MKRRIFQTSILSMSENTRSMRRWTSLRFLEPRRKRSASTVRSSFTWTPRSTITKRTSEWLSDLFTFNDWMNDDQGSGYIFSSLLFWLPFFSSSFSSSFSSTNISTCSSSINTFSSSFSFWFSSILISSQPSALFSFYFLVKKGLIFSLLLSCILTIFFLTSSQTSPVLASINSFSSLFNILNPLSLRKCSMSIM